MAGGSAGGPSPCPTAERSTEDIALEMAASFAQRIRAGDEEAAPLQAMLNKIIQADMASSNLRKANAAAGAVAQAAVAKEREAEAEAKRTELKRKGLELPPKRRQGHEYGQVMCHTCGRSDMPHRAKR